MVAYRNQLITNPALAAKMAAVRLAGNILDRALHDFAAILDVRFLHTRSRNRGVIFDALASDHLVPR